MSLIKRTCSSLQLKLISVLTMDPVAVTQYYYPESDHMTLLLPESGHMTLLLPESGHMTLLLPSDLGSLFEFVEF